MDKYVSSVLNDTDESKCKIEFTSKVRLTNRGLVDTVSPEEVCLYVSGLEESKGPTVGGVPN